MLPPITCLIWPFGQVPSSTSTDASGGKCPIGGSFLRISLVRAGKFFGIFSGVRAAGAGAACGGVRLADGAAAGGGADGRGATGDGVAICEPPSPGTRMTSPIRDE